jgi:hypothetical protein
MNTMNFIHAYRVPTDRSFWCFDDARFGLSQELFMHGASAFITGIVGEECERAELIFSTTPFPTANCILTREWEGTTVATNGCEYSARSPISNEPAAGDKVVVQEGVWLCPAMTHYLGKEQAPEFIYGQITPSSKK